VVDIVLLFGRIVLLALVYLFLFAAVRAGMGAVREAAAACPGELSLLVAAGPKASVGVRMPLIKPIVVGRSPEADLVISDDFLSAKHAVVRPEGQGAVLEDLGSTNGTSLSGARVDRPTPVGPGDVVELGRVRIKVERR